MRRTSTEPPQIDAAAFSELLARLYRLARQSDVQSFQGAAVELLRGVLPFDSCWWGTGTLIEGHHHVHSSYLWNMPSDMPELLNRTESQNVVARRCAAAPNRAVRFLMDELFSNAAMEYMSRHAGHRQILCVSTLHQASRLVTFLSVARHGPEPEFSDRDGQLFELLMPHLTDMLDMNRLLQIAQQRTYHANIHSALAATDIKGFLHVAEPGFEQFVQLEWPDWSGPWLPAPVLLALQNRKSGLRGEQIRMDFQWRDTQVLVSVRRHSPADELSAQELAVAQAFASGHSYKEVARSLKLAPATVRYYLRAAYAKLGVNDKSTLVKALQNPPAVSSSAAEP